MYKNISDYGIIGDMHSIALVSYDGSIDYCSMPHIDSPTVFAALLDDEKGGLFSIRPEEKFTSQQEYIKNTNILKCTFFTESGVSELIDFMPVNTNNLFDKEEHTIHRCLKVISGTMSFKLECSPRPRYALEVPFIDKEAGTFIIKGKKEVFTLAFGISNDEAIEKSIRSGRIIIHFSLKEGGEAAHFDFVYGQRQQSEIEGCSLEETQAFWLNWLHSCMAGKCSFLGEYTDMLNRSLLVLKILTFQPTGAIAAAATTSLPESIGGERNWDYRFSWIRDASFTLKALFALGHISEADSFIRWLHQTYEKYGSGNLQIMYSLQGGRNIPEELLTYLKGYKSSKPVRTGNSAFRQNQWDIYGEIMDSALRLSDYAGKIDESLWPFFRDICNLAVQNWRKPDDGIWEVRNGPFHFVYSKVMCWVALDRGIKIARRYGFDAPLKEWERDKERIKEEILHRGYNREMNTFVQHYDSKQLDASLLLLPLMGFLPIDDEHIKGTIEACKKYLMKESFLMRYAGKDGLKAGEGAFLLCNFWLIECLALSGRMDEARSLLDTTLKAANHLGLFSEEYDAKNNVMLGNFPQAFSHIGFINAAWAVLNAHYKMPESTAHKNWLKRIGKLIPYKIILNKTERSFVDTNKDIAHKLKVALNNLQGAFFNVEEGRVNYDAMRKSQSYKSYGKLAEKLNTFNPYTLQSDAEKKAFWINIYNILIIHGVIELDIHRSVKEVFSFFSRIGYIIGGGYLSADDIEHGILRRNSRHPRSRKRQFSKYDKRIKLCVKRFDPRIHFALVCAASSCPPIEFYEVARIQAQLDLAARSFLKRKGLILNRDKNILYLSQIFKWYLKDFGQTEREMVKYIANFAERRIREDIIRNLGHLRIKYLAYDWNLNRTMG